MKTVMWLRKGKLRSVPRGGRLFTLAAAVCKLVQMRNLVERRTPICPRSPTGCTAETRCFMRRSFPVAHAGARRSQQPRALHPQIFGYQLPSDLDRSPCQATNPCRASIDRPVARLAIRLIGVEQCRRNYNAVGAEFQQTLVPLALGCTIPTIGHGMSVHMV